MSREGIAIVGMACVFPQAPDLRTFWRNVLGCVDAVGEPAPEWGAERYLASGRIRTARGGYLRELYRFDPLAFGIMPSSVDGGEPDQLLALQVARDALADAGYAGKGHDHRETGIVLGHSTYLHRGQVSHVQHHVVLDQTLELLRAALPDADEAALAELRERLRAKLPPSNADVAPGLVPNVMTGRIANRLDLHGPNYLVDAACSSSLLAVAAAMDELWSGRSRAMLAGGVNASLPAEVSLIFTQLGALSGRGRVRPFEEGSDGTLLGEGLGVVLLKRLGDALADGDRVYAVLRGVGQASDGRGHGLLAPSEEGEALAIERAYAASGVDPASVELVEAHGTGIPLGDRTEVAALKRVLGPRRGPQGHVALGSVKSMISHCIPAAGIAGLIKTALALHHRVLPPTLCERVSPALGLADTPLYVNTAPRPWAVAPGRTRRAGVDSFGFGGINAHAVLEEAPRAARRPADLSAWPHELCVLSAADDVALAVEIARVRALCEARGDLALGDLAATLAADDRGGPCRLALVARDADELAAKLRQAERRLADGGDARWATRRGAVYAREPLAGEVAFLFPGEGSQYLGMLSDVAQAFEEVRGWLGFWRGLYDDLPGATRTDLLLPPASELTDARRAELEARLHDMDVGSEAVFVAAQGLCALLRRLGVRPDAMVGHSTGESSALVAAGALPSDDLGRMADLARGLNASYRELAAAGRIPTGALLTVGALGRERLEARLAEHGGAVRVAMDNCPNEQVLFGSPEAVAALRSDLSADGAICTLLPFDRGYHTPRFAAVRDAFAEVYDAAGLRAPVVPLYSCATADLFPADDTGARRLAADQWVRTVRFRETVLRMHDDGVRFFVEVGPAGSLSAFVNDALTGREAFALPTDTRRRGGLEALLTVLGTLWAHRRWEEPRRLFEGRAWRPVDLDEHAPAKPRGMRLDNTLPVLRLDAGDRAALRALAPAPARAPGAAASGPVPVPLPVPVPVQVHGPVHGPVHEPGEDADAFPLLGEVLELDARHVRATCDLDLAEDRFLQHHVLSGPVSAADPELAGLSCVPLAASLEILAEAAALLAGSAALRTLEDVRVLDWIALDDEVAELEVSAERTADGRIAARLVDGGRVVVSALVGFEPDWCAPALAPLAERRPFRWSGPELYATGMFHGPLMQSVEHVLGWDDQGLDAALGPCSLDGYLDAGERPALVLNPVLLDALGQLAAFWVAQQVGTDFNSFPSSIGRIELYRDRPEGLAGWTLRGRQRPLGEGGSPAHGARAWQLECLDGEGRPVFRAVDLVSVFFAVPNAFYRLRHRPLDGALGRPFRGLAAGGVRLWQLEHLSEAFCAQSSGIFLRILAHAVLDAEEREEWRELDGSPRRRRQWLLGRLCLKEAVRSWLLERTGRRVHLADIAVLHDELGAPRVDGWWAGRLAEPPSVSLAHDADASLAAVAEPGAPVGVDLERVGRVRHEAVAAGGLAAPERAALERFPEGERAERVLRLWCAKEAAAKALRTGMLGRPGAFVVSFLRDEWRDARVRHGEHAVDVCVARSGDHVVALAGATAAAPTQGASL